MMNINNTDILDKYFKDAIQSIEVYLLIIWKDNFNKSNCNSNYLRKCKYGLFWQYNDAIN